MPHKRFAVALVPLVALAVHGQPAPIVVPSAPTCAACTIQLRKVATVGKPDDPELLVPYTELGRGPGGSFIATIIRPSPRVLLFDSAGRFVRQLGRQGQGPGEFSGWANFLGTGRGDSAYFVDQGRRYSAFTPSLVFVRMIPYSGPPVLGPLPLPNGTFVGTVRPGVSASPSGPIRQPYTNPAVLISAEGEIVRRFGTVDPAEGQACVPCSTRYASLTRDGAGFWLVRRNTYDIRRFTLDGEERGALTVRDSPWMQPWTALPTAPYAHVEQVSDGGGGRIWVVGRAPPPGETRFIRAGTAAWDVRREQNLSTVIEVIDVERGTLLVSRRFEREVYSFIDADHVIRQREAADGTFSFDVYRIELRQR
jgi:hypothetical protein